MRVRADRDELDVSNKSAAGYVIKDASLGLFKMLCFLIVFVVGVVVGLISSSHIDRYFTLQAAQLYSAHAPPAALIAPTASYHAADPIKNCSTTITTTIVMNCNKEDCLSMDSFVRPKNLTHGMSDDELFWRASLVPSKVEYPYVRVPKVAFMFLTRGPLPFLPLWEKFFEGQDSKKFSIYVHALPGYRLNVTNSSVFYNRQIPSQVRTAT